MEQKILTASFVELTVSAEKVRSVPGETVPVLVSVRVGLAVEIE